MSNCIGVSGATSESKESADKVADSDPTDPVLLVWAAVGRDCLKQYKKWTWRCVNFRLVDNKFNYMEDEYNIPKTKPKKLNKIRIK